MWKKGREKDYRLYTMVERLAKEIIANYEPQFGSVREYLDAIDELTLDKDAVVYDENGNATIDFQK